MGRACLHTIVFLVVCFVAAGLCMPLVTAQTDAGAATPNRAARAGEATPDASVLPVSDSDATIIAAALALVGTLVVGTVAFLGHKFRKSYEERSLALKEQEQERLRVEKRRDLAHREQEQARLRVDTVVGVLHLLSTDSGKEVAASQRAGALVALVRLEELDFATMLLASMWPEGRIDSSAATWIVNEGLSSESPVVQDRAAGILRDNSARVLLANGGYRWPDCVTWKIQPGLSKHARQALLEALVSIVHCRSADEWEPESLVGVYQSLRAMVNDEEFYIRAGAVRGALAVLLEVGKHFDSIPKVPDGGHWDLADARTDLEGELAKFENDPNHDAAEVVLHHVAKIEEWAGKPPVVV